MDRTDIEQLILAAALQHRPAFEDLRAVDAQKILSQQGTEIWKVLVHYYERDEKAQEANPDLVLARLKRDKPKFTEAWENLVPELLREVSFDNVIEEAAELKCQNLRMDMEAALAASKIEKFDQLQREYQEVREHGLLVEGGKRVFTAEDTAWSMSEYLESRQEANRIKLLPAALNKQIGGGMIRQHHALFYARPNMGKSSWASYLVAGFVRQKLRVLYVSNEQPKAECGGRVGQCLKNISEDEWKKLPAAEQERLTTELGIYEYVTFLNLTPGTLDELWAAMEQFQPDVLVVDQARNILPGGRNASRTECLDTVERNIRSMGQKYNALTISLTQAGESAEGKLILGMGDIDSSKTGMQAHSDLMVGMGASTDWAWVDPKTTETRRMLSITKSKYGPVRNPTIAVTFNINTGRFT